MSLKGKIRHKNVQHPIKFYFFPPHKRNLYNSWRKIYSARWWLTWYIPTLSNFLHLISAIVSNAVNFLSWYVSLVEPTVKTHWMSLFIGSLHMSSNAVCNSYIITISLELCCVRWESEREPNWPFPNYIRVMKLRDLQRTAADVKISPFFLFKLISNPRLYKQDKPHMNN